MRHARRSTDLTAVAPIRKEEGKVESKKKSHKHSKGSRKSYKMSTPRGSKPQQQQQAPRTELDYEIERLKSGDSAGTTNEVSCEYCDSSDRFLDLIWPLITVCYSKF